MYLRPILPLKLLLLTLLLPIGATTLAAQLPFPIRVEVRGGIGIPTGSFATSADGLNTESGPAFAAGIFLEPVAIGGLYAGYQQVRFGCSRCAEAGLDGSTVLAGPEAGVHLSLPIAAGPVEPWLRATVLYHSLAFSGMGDRMTSAAEVGFGGGAGVTYPIADRLSVSPGVRFLSFPAEFEFATLPDRSVDVTAVSLEIGFAFRF